MFEQDIISEYEDLKNRYKKPISKELKNNKSPGYSIYPIGRFGNHSKRTHEKIYRKSIKSRERRERKDITPSYFSKKYIKYGHRYSKPDPKKIFIRRTHISEQYYYLLEDNMLAFNEKSIIQVDFFDFFDFEDFSTEKDYYLGNIKIKKEFSDKIIIRDEILRCSNNKTSMYYTQNLHYGNEAKSFIIQFSFIDKADDVIYQTLFYRKYMKINTLRINFASLVEQNPQKVDKNYRNQLKRNISWILVPWMSEKYLGGKIKYMVEHNFYGPSFSLLKEFYEINSSKDALFYIFDSKEILTKSASLVDNYY